MMGVQSAASHVTFLTGVVVSFEAGCPRLSPCFRNVEQRSLSRLAFVLLVVVAGKAPGASLLRDRYPAVDAEPRRVLLSAAFALLATGPDSRSAVGASEVYRWRWMATHSGAASTGTARISPLRLSLVDTFLSLEMNAACAAFDNQMPAAMLAESFNNHPIKVPQLEPDSQPSNGLLFAANVRHG
jgi:hypothetical protein